MNVLTWTVFEWSGLIFGLIACFVGGVWGVAEFVRLRIEGKLRHLLPDFARYGRVQPGVKQLMRALAAQPCAPQPNDSDTVTHYGCDRRVRVYLSGTLYVRNDDGHWESLIVSPASRRALAKFAKKQHKLMLQRQAQEEEQASLMVLAATTTKLEEASARLSLCGVIPRVKEDV